jgi:hypothetical protein
MPTPPLLISREWLLPISQGRTFLRSLIPEFMRKCVYLLFIRVYVSF